MNIILCIGMTIVWLLAIVIFLTQRRLERIMSLIVADDTHPYTVVMPSKRFKVQRIMSYVIPTLCGILLTVGAVLSLLGYLMVK